MYVKRIQIEMPLRCMRDFHVSKFPQPPTNPSASPTMSSTRVGGSHPQHGLHLLRFLWWKRSALPLENLQEQKSAQQRTSSGKPSGFWPGGFCHQTKTEGLVPLRFSISGQGAVCSGYRGRWPTFFITFCKVLRAMRWALGALSL